MLSAVIEEFPKLSQTSTKDYFLSMGLGERVIDELVEAVVTTNYNQDTDIQSFVSLVSLAGASKDLWSVKGGNKGVMCYRCSIIYLNYLLSIKTGTNMNFRW